MKNNLTPVEYELMDILWEIKSGTVHEVIAKLPRHRPLAYTTVSTMLRILQQKKILTAFKSGRQHIYKPLLNRENFAKTTVKKVVKQVFKGNPANLIAHLIEEQWLTVEEVNAITQLMESKKPETSS